MKNLSQATEEKLLEYIDGTLRAPDGEEMAQQLRSNSTLRGRYEELKRVHDALRATTTEAPSANFTKAVMNRLNERPVPATFSTRNGIILLVVAILAAAMATVLLSMGVFDNVSTPTVDLTKINLPKNLEQPLNSFHMDVRLMINVIIILNLALAFMLLDRAVLRPYFKRRMLDEVS